MSTFLAYDSFLIPPSSTVTSAMATIESSFTGAGRAWQIVGKTLPSIARSLTYNGTAQTQFLADAVYDGMEFSYFLSANTSSNAVQPTPTVSSCIPTIATIQMSTSESVARYEIIMGGGTNSSQIRDWTIQSSPDGTTWTTVDTQTNCPILYRGERKQFTISGTPTARAYWRINITGTWSTTGSMYLPKVRFYNTSDQLLGIRYTVYMEPPASEFIGDSNRCDTVMILAQTTGTLTQNVIYVAGQSRFKSAFPAVYTIKQSVAGAVVYGIGACGVNNVSSFGITGSITQGQPPVLTVTATSGAIYPGMIISGNTSIPPGCVILTQTTGTTGSTGTYTLSAPLPSSAVSSGTLTVSGTAVTITGIAGNTNYDNLRLLYTALKNSTDANFTDYDYRYSKPSPINTDDTNEYIYCIQKVPTYRHLSQIGAINTNCVLYQSANYSPAGIYSLECSANFFTLNLTSPFLMNCMTLDVTNGFVYYLQLNSRGFALAVKTNTAYFGPIHAVYGDHAKALASMPASIHPKLISPCELLTGYDHASSATPSYSMASAAKHYSMSNSTDITDTIRSTLAIGQSGTAGLSLVGNLDLRDTFVDSQYVYSQFGSGTDQSRVALVPSGIFTIQTSNNEIALENDFQIHRMVLNGNAAHSSQNGIMLPANRMAFTPMLDFQDWYKFVGTASSEALALVPDITIQTTLGMVMDSTTAYTTLTLASTAGFYAASVGSPGFVIIENEVIKYTGISGATLTGVTRAQYGTAMQNHWSGDIVYQGQWFTLINGGALYAGYAKPV